MNRARSAALLIAGVLALALPLWLDRARAPEGVGRGARRAGAPERGRASRSGPPTAPSARASSPAAPRGIEVRLRAGAELAEGSVELRCVDAPGVRELLPLERAGVLRSQLCGAGATCLRLRHPSLQQREAWVVEAGRSEQLGAESKALVEGVVQDARGSPIAGAQLRLSVGERLRLASRTDAEGEFALLVPALRPCDACDPEPARDCQPADASGPGAAQILVQAEGYAPTQLPLELGESSVSLELELASPAPPVSGSVLGAGGQAFTTRTKVLATNIDRGGEQHVTFVDEQGQFRLEGLADARYRLRVLLDGIELARVEEVRPGAQLELQASREARGSTWRVRVLDARGVAQSEARVDGGPFEGSRTDGEGWVEAAQVLPAEYVLWVRAQACAMERFDARVPRASVARGSTTELELRLRSDCQSP